MLVLRDVDIILKSIRILGYEDPDTSGLLDDRLVASFFHVDLGPIQRLFALIKSIGAELDSLRWRSSSQMMSWVEK